MQTQAVDERAPGAGSSRTVAIVILTWNQRELTLRALASLADCGYADASILLWDNGSEDDTVAAVRESFPQVLVHRSPVNLGVASGRNAAAQMAVQEFGASHLLFLDNDMTVTEGFVEALLEAFERDPTVAQAEAKILTMHDPGTIFCAGGTLVSFWRGRIRPAGAGEPDDGRYDTEGRCLPSGGATMVRADVFGQLGGFDAAFNPYGPEDVDFSLRVAAAGYKGWYVPRSVIYHETKDAQDETRQAAGFNADRTRHFLTLLGRHASPVQKLGFFLLGMPATFFRVLRRQGNAKSLAGMVRGLIRAARG